jgi:hypothetical protein
MVAESPSGLSTADDPARIGNEFIGIVENTGSEVTAVKKATWSSPRSRPPTAPASSAARTRTCPVSTAPSGPWNLTRAVKRSGPAADSAPPVRALRMGRDDFDGKHEQDRAQSCHGAGSQPCRPQRFGGGKAQCDGAAGVKKRLFINTQHLCNVPSPASRVAANSCDDLARRVGYCCTARPLAARYRRCPTRFV